MYGPSERDTQPAYDAFGLPINVAADPESEADYFEPLLELAPRVDSTRMHMFYGIRACLIDRPYGNKST